VTSSWVVSSLEASLKLEPRILLWLLVDPEFARMMDSVDLTHLPGVGFSLDQA
jgi:hypothetical protein